MRSAFVLHDRSRFKSFVYALSRSDGSRYRADIENSAQHFLDVSEWPTKDIIERIIADGIQICEDRSINLFQEAHYSVIVINLNGYTKGARNDIFAARPCPVQISMMGFAGRDLRLFWNGDSRR